MVVIGLVQGRGGLRKVGAGAGGGALSQQVGSVAEPFCCCCGCGRRRRCGCGCCGGGGGRRRRRGRKPCSRVEAPSHRSLTSKCAKPLCSLAVSFTAHWDRRNSIAPSLQPTVAKRIVGFGVVYTAHVYCCWYQAHSEILHNPAAKQNRTSQTDPSPQNSFMQTRILQVQKFLTYCRKAGTGHGNWLGAN